MEPFVALILVALMIVSFALADARMKKDRDEREARRDYIRRRHAYGPHPHT